MSVAKTLGVEGLKQTPALALAALKGASSGTQAKGLACAPYSSTKQKPCPGPLLVPRFTIPTS